MADEERELRVREMRIRGTHPYCFRSGEWATLVTEVKHATGRRCYLVRFPDGMSDWWPVDDPAADYEFEVVA